MHAVVVTHTDGVCDPPVQAVDLLCSCNVLLGLKSIMPNLWEEFLGLTLLPCSASFLPPVSEALDDLLDQLAHTDTTDGDQIETCELWREVMVKPCILGLSLRLEDEGNFATPAFIQKKQQNCTGDQFPTDSIVENIFIRAVKYD